MDGKLSNGLSFVFLFTAVTLPVNHLYNKTDAEKVHQSALAIFLYITILHFYRVVAMNTSTDRFRQKHSTRFGRGQRNERPFRRAWRARFGRTANVGGFQDLFENGGSKISKLTGRSRLVSTSLSKSMNDTANQYDTDRDHENHPDEQSCPVRSRRRSRQFETHDVGAVVKRRG